MKDGSMIHSYTKQQNEKKANIKVQVQYGTRGYSTRFHLHMGLFGSPG
jgi:hypothetical protein